MPIAQPAPTVTLEGIELRVLHLPLVSPFTTSFGTETVRVPRARIEDDAGKITEWRSKALPRYQRLTKKAEALIASGVISGGMIPKCRTALDAIEAGVDAVVILDGRAPHACLLELFTSHGAGTMITSN